MSDVCTISLPLFYISRLPIILCLYSGGNRCSCTQSQRARVDVESTAHVAANRCREHRSNPEGGRTSLDLVLYHLCLKTKIQRCPLRPSVLRVGTHSMPYNNTTSNLCHPYRTSSASPNLNFGQDPSTSIAHSDGRHWVPLSPLVSPLIRHSHP